MNLFQSIITLFTIKKKPFRYFELDFEQFSFTELSKILRDFSLNLHLENHTMIAKWESDQYVFHIEYDIHGNFQRILTKETKEIPN